jgi:hypothetical protein
MRNNGGQRPEIFGQSRNQPPSFNSAQELDSLDLYSHTWGFGNGRNREMRDWQPLSERKLQEDGYDIPACWWQDEAWVPEWRCCSGKLSIFRMFHDAVKARNVLQKISHASTHHFSRPRSVLLLCHDLATFVLLGILAMQLAINIGLPFSVPSGFSSTTSRLISIARSTSFNIRASKHEGGCDLGLSRGYATHD